MSFLLRRLFFYLLAFWISLTLNFLLPRLAPGDPAARLFGRFQGQLKPEAMEALRAAFGLNQEGIWAQYWTYVGHLFSGDFGISIVYFPEKVTTVMATGLRWTLILLGTSLLISFLLGTGLGIFAAWKRHGWVDRFLGPILIFCGAFPYFWLAMLLLYTFAFQRHWFPTGHAMSDALDFGWGWDVWKDIWLHAFLPGFSLVLATVGGWMLTMRNAMGDVLGQDYVMLARAKGLDERRVMIRYAARNALLPSMTAFATALGFVMGGALLTEVIFSYPGQGYLLVQALRGQDYPLLQGIFLLITGSVLLANFILDLLVLWLDPRVRV